MGLESSLLRSGGGDPFLTFEYLTTFCLGEFFFLFSDVFYYQWAMRCKRIWHLQTRAIVSELQLGYVAPACWWEKQSQGCTAVVCMTAQ